jgi:hypothetical protein
VSFKVYLHAFVVLTHAKLIGNSVKQKERRTNIISNDICRIIVFGLADNIHTMWGYQKLIPYTEEDLDRGIAVRFPLVIRDFLLFQTSKLAVGHTQLHISLENGAVSFSKVKLPRLEAGQSCVLSAVQQHVVPYNGGIHPQRSVLILY